MRSSSIQFVATLLNICLCFQISVGFIYGFPNEGVDSVTDDGFGGSGEGDAQFSLPDEINELDFTDFIDDDDIFENDPFSLPDEINELNFTDFIVDDHIFENEPFSLPDEINELDFTDFMDDDHIFENDPFSLPDEINESGVPDYIDDDHIIASDAEEDAEAITEAQLLFKEIVDTGDDEVKAAGFAMDFINDIKEIPKEIHDTVKDSAHKALNNVKKFTGHVVKLPNQISNMWKQSFVTTENSAEDKRPGLFRFRLG